ncbi:MAG: hypothetical protein WC612_03360 [Bdellovibrionales bacterium]|jgi:hypothetical protein
MNPIPKPANTDDAMSSLSSDQKIVAWLCRMTARNDNAVKHSLATEAAPNPFERSRAFLDERARSPMDDWEVVASLAGHSLEDVMFSGSRLPISAAEIDHFRRNHRETDRLVGRDFLSTRCDLPSPLSELYGLYRHRARLDAESTLFVAQATGSTRVARIMADLLSIGAFASGYECITHVSMTYSVPAAFDTSDLIDRTSDEAERRLALPIETPSHLLKMTPDEISVLANNIVERNALTPSEFIEKANQLSEARQDVHRLPTERHLAAALYEGDLSRDKAWVARLCAAYQRIFPSWPAIGEADSCDLDMPEHDNRVP